MEAFALTASVAVVIVSGTYLVLTLRAGEAQIIRAEAQDELHELYRQSYEVASISRKLARRREQNHFGEELTVSFQPKGRHS